MEYSDKQTFTVTEAHIKLLQHARVSWDDCEFGAPAIDCKRPYGNSSVYYDIAEILGVEPEGDDHELSGLQEKLLGGIHAGTLTALQIFLATGEMKPGTYIADKYKRNWALAE